MPQPAPTLELSEHFEDDPQQLQLIDVPKLQQPAQARPRSRYRPRMIHPSDLTQIALF